MVIDEPRLISRVSSLFCGHNKLILGFNTFLPDDRKIKLCGIEVTNEQNVDRFGNLGRPFN